jgi:SNF2 family DNA or RNA helicase
MGTEENLPPLWRHQQEAIDRAAALPSFALFFEMGTGKTRTAIDILRARFNKSRKILKTLVLCPPIVVKNWREEWLKYSRIDPARVVMLTGSGKDRVAKFDANSAQGTIFVTNYEAMLMPDLHGRLQAWGLEALVLDESHKCKDRKAKRTKLVEQLANPGAFPPFKLLLSGSPVLNSPADLWSQYLILDGGQTFHHNFFVFQARYFRDKNAGMPKHKYFPKWEPIPGALEEISAKIAETGMRVEKKDCLDLPPLIRTTIKVGMTPDQKRMYQEMKRDFITFMKGEAVTAQLALTKALRLMQIASGYVKTADGQELSIAETPKMEALKELLTELAPSHKVIIWAVWKENYGQIERVCKDLGLTYVAVTGDTPSSQRFENVDRFNGDPECRVFIGHPGSGGIGINLVASDVSIFYSRTFSLEHSLQAEARNYRGGSERHAKVTRFDLVCEDTIDETVTEMLANKTEISEKVLRDLSLELENQETKG